VLFEVPLFGRYFPIHGYGLMVALGFLAAIYISMWRARRVGIAPRHVMNLGLLALLGGVVGARIGFLIQDWSNPRWQNPWEIFNIQGGGLTVTGGIPLGMGLIMLYLRRKRIRVHRFLDVIAPAVAIGLVFGRMGCLLNGCCFGAVADVPWAIRFPAGSPAYHRQHKQKQLLTPTPAMLLREPGQPAQPAQPGRPGRPEQPGQPLGYRNLAAHSRDLAGLLAGGKPRPAHLEGEPFLARFRGRLDSHTVAVQIHGRLRALAWDPRHMSRPVHPTQVYHQIAGLLMFALLTWHWRHRRKEGQIAAAFVVLYGVQRFTIEFFRDDSDPVLGPLSPFQVYMIFAMAAGLLWYALIWRLAKPADTEQIAAEVAELEKQLADQRAERARRKAASAEKGKAGKKPRAAAAPAARGKRRRRR
jgi:phosphatidylglycerol:prolipoprotein diacylglycerol transferase